MTMPLQRLVLFVLLAAASIVPLFLGSYWVYLVNLFLINAIVAVGLNMLTGNAGQISLCHSSFMALGAYTTAVLSTRYGVSFWLTLPVAMAIAGGTGALLGFPARRLSDIYLALATFGFLQIVQIAIEEFSDLTGGVRGISIAKPSFFGVPLTSDRSMYCVVLSAAVVMIWIAANVMRSRFGRAFNAIRQSPYAAQALGLPVGRIKLIAFALSAVYAGIGGSLMAAVAGFIDPLEFNVVAALRHITFIVVGGLGSIPGSVIGAFVLTALPEALRGAKEYMEVIYAAILLLSLLFMPKGLIAGWEFSRDLVARRIRSRRGTGRAAPVD
jgi:branched-chain amino acid transport system permease protein